MKTLLLTTLCAVAMPAFCQQMPGMNMPGSQPKQTGQPASKKAGLPAAPAPAMKGMEGMPGMAPMHTDEPVDLAPGDSSVTHDTFHLQEPEHPDEHTGENLPVPDLLNDVATRRPLSLEELLAEAARLNPTLAQSHATVQGSAAQAEQAGLYPNPTVGYEGDQIRGGSYGGGEQGGFIQQTVVLGGKLGLRRNVFRQQGAADRISLEEQEVRVRHDVTEAFYSALEAQAEVVLRQRLLSVARDAMTTVHLLANVGQADAPDILQTEVESEQAGIDFVSAQREYLSRFSRLAAVAGRTDLVVSPLTGSLESPPALDAEAAVDTAVANSPEVKRAQAEILVSEARLKSARREAVPDLQLRAGEQYNLEQLNAAPVKPAGPQSFAQAGVDLPLFNRNQGAVRAAQAQLESARQDVTRQQLIVRATLQPVAQSFAQARFSASRYRTELIPRAQRAYQLYLGKYQAMASAYPQVLVSQRTLFQLQIAYLHALEAQWKAANDLQSFGLRDALTQSAPAVR